MDIRTAVSAASKALALHRAVSRTGSAPFLAFCECLTRDLEVAIPQPPMRAKLAVGLGRSRAKANVLVVGGPLAGDDVEFPLTRLILEPLVGVRHAHVVEGASPSDRRLVPDEGAAFLADFLARLAAHKVEMASLRADFERLWPLDGPSPRPDDVAGAMPELALHFPPGVLVVQ